MDIDSGADKLPLVPLLHTLRYLDLPDLLRASLTCRSWSNALQEQSLWREICLKMQVEVPAGTQDYKQVLEAWSEHFADFRAYYPRMRSLYLRLTEILGAHAPSMLSALVKSISRAEFNEICQSMRKTPGLETAEGSVLPGEVGCWFLICSFDSTVKLPLFGALECYHMFLGAIGIPLRDAMTVSPVRDMQGSIRLLPPYLRLALVDSGELKKGNLWMTTSYKTNFVVADGWANYLENYIELLERKILPISRVDGVSKWPAQGIPEAKTRQTTVTASHVHHPGTGATQWLFMYFITISMPKDATANKSKLKTRHWKIEHLDGSKDSVDGPGVIGLYPEIGPGDSFSYSSCCASPTPGGFMHGHFVMEDLVTGEEWNLEVPLMAFRIQETITSETLASLRLQTS